MLQYIKTTTNEMLCPRGLHRCQDICLCLDPEGQSDPRLCHCCEYRPSTRSHNHHHNEEEEDEDDSDNSNPPKCTSLSKLNELNSGTEFYDFIQLIEGYRLHAVQETSKLTNKLKQWSQQLEETLKSFDLYLKFMREEAELKGRARRTSDLIKNEQWDGLTCQDLQLFHQYMASQQYDIVLEKTKNKVMHDTAKYRSHLEQINSRFINLTFLIQSFRTTFSDFRFDDKRILLQRSDYHGECENYRLASLTLRRFLQVDFQKRAITYNRLARLHDDLQDKEESLKFDIKNLQHTATEKIRPLNNVAIQFKQTEQYEKAKEYYIKAVREWHIIQKNLREKFLGWQILQGIKQINKKLGIWYETIVVAQSGQSQVAEVLVIEQEKSVSPEVIVISDDDT